jgi:simple sugar transport system ATP-binding protein
VVGRELSKRPAVVVAENPTRGLDIRATATIHSWLRHAAAEGAAVVVHSSDLDEVLALSTRVLVARRGGLIEPPADADRDALGALMLAAG